MDLQALIKQGSNPAKIADHLDHLPHQERLRQALGLGRTAQRNLFELVQGDTTLDLAHFVPEDRADMEEVIHWGRNTLPAFTRFQKRFCRPRKEEVGSQPVLWGYNQQTLLPLTGPGYFHARPGQPDTPVWIDYRGEPPVGRLASWPRQLHNRQRLSRVIYYGTIDKMRRVSQHVSIGAAFRGAKPMHSWFILCREDR